MALSTYSLPVFLLVVVVALLARAAVHPQDYWKSVLPHTPMPGAVRDLLQPADVVDDMATSVSVGKGGVHVNAGKLGKTDSTTVNVGHNGVGVTAPGTTVNVGHKGVGVTAPGTTVNVGHKGVGVTAPGTHVGVGGGGVHVSAGKGKPGSTGVNVGHGGVGVNVGGHRGKKPPVVVTVPGYGHKGFDYRYAATETQVHDDPNAALFFQEEDLRPGAKMSVHFTRTTPGAAFIPRSAANAVPFSSKRLPEILARYSLQPSSLEARTVEETLRRCEEPAVAGETSYCATSLESMVDFATASLGTREVRAVSTEVGKRGTPKQLYTITPSGVQRLAGSRAVACHAEPYAYAVFYCHATRATTAYVVPLVGEDGARVNSVAVCHADTSSWNPKHLAFQVLKMKPGTVPVCHFLPQDHIVWAPRY